MKIFICVISLISVASATFGKLNLLGGGSLNSLLGGGGGGLFGGSFSGRSSAGFSNGGKGLNGGTGPAIEENYISIVDQLGPGTVIDKGILRKRAPKISDVGSVGVGGVPLGGHGSGGGYNSGDGGAGTIVNIYGDPSGGFGGSAEGGHGGYGGAEGSHSGVTVIRVIHERASAHDGYSSSSLNGPSGGFKVYKIIENTSYGGDSSGSSDYNNVGSNSGNSGWAPVSGHSGW